MTSSERPESRSQNEAGFLLFFDESNPRSIRFCSTFDLLILAGTDLRSRPLEQRRALPRECFLVYAMRWFSQAFSESRCLWGSQWAVGPNSSEFAMIFEPRRLR